MAGVHSAATGADFYENAIMISLTRLNGQAFVVNAERIRYVEQTPDTMLCCDNGEKLMVKETLQEVIKRSIEYGRQVRRGVLD